MEEHVTNFRHLFFDVRVPTRRPTGLSVKKRKKREKLEYNNREM